MGKSPTSPTTSRPSRAKARPKPAGEPRLSEIARHAIAPAGIVSTAWPSVREKCRELGLGFDPWQHGAGKLILAKRSTGLYAAGIGGVVISIPRQVGKTYLLGAIVFALCLLNPNLTVIWTAHRLRTSKETFTAMKAMAKRKKIAPHVLKIVLGSGEEEIQFRNGSRILFGARERGFGVGFAGVDVLVLDEAQRATEAALDDLVPTTNTSPNPLIFFAGTPPRPTDPGEVFRQKRAEAISGEDTDTAYIEFSADKGAKPDDWAQVRKANPSHPLRTPREAILRMRKNLTPASFLREGMGIWDERQVHESVIPSAAWNKRKVTAAKVPKSAPVAFAVDMSPDRVVSVAVCVQDDESRHVELAALDKVTTTAGVIDWLVERAGRRIPVYIDSESPAVAMVATLRSRGVKVNVVSKADMVKACGGLYDAVLEGRLTHFNQTHLNDALAAATKLLVGKAGGWRWNRDNPETDISCLVAVTLAWFGSTLKKPRTNRVVTA